MKQTLIATLVVGLLASCGGGGGDSSTPGASSGFTPSGTTTSTSNPPSSSSASTPTPGNVSTPANSVTTTEVSQQSDSHVPPPVITPPVVAPVAPEPSPAANVATTNTSTTVPPVAPTVSPSTPSTPTSPALPLSPGANASALAAAFLKNITAPTPPSSRSTQDNPDDYTDSQIHVIYAVPKGESDRGFDVTTKFTNSITVWNNWLSAQTEGRKIKFDTYQGKLDITYVALPRTDQEYSVLGANGRIQAVTSDLNQALGGLRSNKKYMVYFEGGKQYTSDYVACGDTNLGYNVIFQYLLADPKNIGSCFNGRDFAATPFVEPRYLDYIMLHELIHAEGGVSNNAPNVIKNHLDGDERDIMAYAGNFDGWKILDVTRANYYNPNGLPPGVYNFANSPFLTAK